MRSTSAFEPGGDRPDDKGTLLQALSRRKAVFVASFSLVVAFGWAVLANMPRRYSAEAILAIDSRKVNVLDNEVVSRLPGEMVALRTELDLIVSRMLAERVADRLNLVADRDVQRELQTDYTVLGSLAATVSQAVKLASTGVIELGQPPVAHTLAPSRSDVVDWLSDGVKASNDGRSLTIFLKFNAGTPELAARIAGAFAAEYLDDQVSRKAAEIQRAGRWLAERVAEIRRDVEATDAAVMGFRRSSGLIEAKGITVLGQQLTELTSQLAAARSERARVEGKLQMARTSNGHSLPEVLASATIHELRVQLSKLEAHDAQNAHVLYLRPERERAINSLKSRINTEISRVVASLSSDADAARAREVSLVASMNRLQSEYEEASTGSVKLGQLERDAETNRKVYETLSSRHKQAAEQASLAMPEARLIAAPQVSNRPASPKTLPTLLLSCLAGTLIGGVTAVARDRMVNRVHEDDEVEAITGVPVLGVMPKRVGFVRPRLPALAPDDGAALLGVPQWIHARLRQSGSTHRAMVVLVTSATVSEDTTHLSTCLAGRLAGDGARVLWIDADPYRLGRPRTFRPPQDSASAAEAACRKDQAVRVDPGSGAHFLAAAPEKSRDMLDARQLTRLVERVRTHYDVVILDGSPILAGGNAVTVAGIADARLFVAECGRTRRDRLLTALSVLRNCGSMADGFVLTGVEPRRVYTVLSVRQAEPSPVASVQIAHA